MLAAARTTTDAGTAPSEPTTTAAATTDVVALETTTPAAAAVPGPDWGWPLPQYPDVDGFTKTEVAAVVFIGLAGATISSLAVNPLLAIPLALMTLTAFGRFVELGTNHLPTATYSNNQPVLGTITGQVIATDPDGDPLTYAVAQQGEKGLVIVDPLTGGYIYTANNLGTAPTQDTFYVTVDDSLGIFSHPIAFDGHSVTIAVTVDIPGISLPQPPVFSHGATVTETDSQTGVIKGTFEAYDPEGGTLTFGGVAALGTVTVDSATQTFTYTPYDAHAAALVGNTIDLTDLVTISATDDQGLITLSSTTVHLVTTVNQAPSATFENTGGSAILGTVTGKIIVTDADDSVHAFTPVIITTDKGSVIVSALTGDYTYTASLAARQAASSTTAPASAKTDTFTITVDDLHGGTTDVVVTVTIPTVNLAPTIDSTPTITATNNQTGVLTGTFKAHDPNGDTLSFTSAALLGSVSVNTTPDADGNYTFTYTPYDAHAAVGLNLTDLVTITAWDSNLGSDSATFTVHLANAVNQAPTATFENTSSSTVLGTVTGKIIVTDADDSVHAFTPVIITTDKGSVIVSALTGDYTYTASLAARQSASSTTAPASAKTDTFTITVDDLHGGTTDVVVTVTIPVVNLSPSMDSTPTITATNNQTGVLTGTFKAHDPNGDTLSFTSAALLGSVSVNTTPDADGNYTFTYTPYDAHAAAGLNLTDLVTITAWDSSLASSSATFTVHLANAVNQLPVTTYQNTGSNSVLGTVTGKVTVTSDDDTVHSFSPVIITTDKGSVIVSALTGDYTYTASLAARNAASATSASAADKIDTFTVTVDDLHGGTTNVVVTVNIPTINIPPVGGVPSNTLADSNGVVRGAITAVINADGDPLSYSIKGAGGADTAYTGTGGIVHVDTAGNYVYIPKASSSSTIADSFTVVVSDGRGGTSEVLVAVGVLGLTSSLNNVSVSANNSSQGVVTGAVSLSSAANNALFTSYAANGADYGTVAFNGTTYTYTRTAIGHTGGTEDTFDVIGTAYGLQMVVATVTVTPTMANAAPTAGTTTITSSSLTNVLGVYWQSSSGKVTAADADGDTITYPGGSIIPATYTTANGGTVSFYSNGTFDYTIAKTASYYHGASAIGATGNAVNDTFTINVTDGFGGSTNIVVSIPIEKLNKNPDSSASVSSSTDALGVVRGTITGGDDDNDSLTYTLAGAGNPAGATGSGSYTTNGGIIALSGNSFVYIPTKSASTTDTFKVLITDGHGGSSIATISVAQGTPSPTSNITTATNTQSGKLAIPGADAGLLTYSLGSGPTKGSVVVNADGSYTYTRDSALGHSATPNDSFTITGTDANGRSVTIATVNVAPPVANTAPTPGTTTITSSSLGTYNVIYKRQTTTGTLSASDANGDSVSFSAGTYSTTNGGSVTVNANGSFTYTIDKGLTTSYYHDAAKIGASGNAVADSFSVTVTDGFGGSTTYTQSVSIYAENSAPSLSGGVSWPGSKFLGTYGYYTSVFGSDGDGDSLSYAITGQPAHGSASYSPGSQILSTSGTSDGDIVTLTVYDGYYVVNNGVVSTTPSSTSRQYTIKRGG